MNASLFESQVHAYLTHQMSPDERAAFEALLHTDAAARNLYLRFTLKGEGVGLLAREQQLRAYAQSLRAQSGPLPEPKLSWLDRLRIAWYARPLRTGLSALFAILSGTLLLVFIWVNVGGIRDTNAIVKAAYEFVEPPHGSLAGAPEMRTAPSKREIFEKAAGYYWNTRQGAADSLRALSQQPAIFSFADYYLAHWLLKTGEWTAAKNGLEQCLSHRDYFLDLDDTRDTEPMHLQFNLLLARLGESGRYEDIRGDLDRLVASLPATELTVRKAADLVRREMDPPLRQLRIR